MKISLAREATHALRPLANQSVVVGMRADPEPEIAAVHVNGEGTVAWPDPDGPVTSDLLELQRRMAQIAFQKLIVRVGQLSNRKRQSLVGGPEFR